MRYTSSLPVRMKYSQSQRVGTSEARIAMAGHHRYLYYLTGDRRLEDIFEELKDNEMSFLNKAKSGPETSFIGVFLMSSMPIVILSRYFLSLNLSHLVIQLEHKEDQSGPLLA